MSGTGTRRRILLATSTLVLAACSGRAREASPARPAPGPPDLAPAPAPAPQPTEPLRPGSYEPFEAPPAPVPGDSARRSEPVRDPRRGVPETRGAGAAPSAGLASAYVIQVAAFAEAEPAQDLAELLGRRYGDYPIRVVTRAGLHRVWLGGWERRDDAASVLVIVRQRYPDAWIVAP